MDESHPVNIEEFMPMQLVGIDCNPEQGNEPVAFIFELCQHQGQYDRFCRIAYGPDLVAEAVEPGWVWQSLQGGDPKKSMVRGGTYYLLDPYQIEQQAAVLAYGQSSVPSRKSRPPRLFGFTDPMVILFDILQGARLGTTRFYIPRHLRLCSWVECFHHQAEVLSCTVYKSAKSREVACSLYIVCYTQAVHRSELQRRRDQLFSDMWLAVAREQYLRAAALRDQISNIDHQIAAIDDARSASQIPARAPSP